MIGSPLAHLPAAEHDPEMIVDTWINFYTVAMIDGKPPLSTERGRVRVGGTT